MEPAAEGTARQRLKKIVKARNGKTIDVTAIWAKLATRSPRSLNEQLCSRACSLTTQRPA